MIIKAECPKINRKMEAEANLGANLQEKIDLFGETAVNNAAEDAITINIQALMRRAATAGKTDEEIQALVASYKPGTSVRIAGDPLKAFDAKFDSMTPEEQEAYITDLMERRKS